MLIGPRDARERYRYRQIVAEIQLRRVVDSELIGFFGASAGSVQRSQCRIPNLNGIGQVRTARCRQSRRQSQGQNYARESAGQERQPPVANPCPDSSRPLRGRGWRFIRIRHENARVHSLHKRTVIVMASEGQNKLFAPTLNIDFVRRFPTAGVEATVLPAIDSKPKPPDSNGRSRGSNGKETNHSEAAVQIPRVQ
jgi:hypothetical protein